MPTYAEIIEEIRGKVESELGCHASHVKGSSSPQYREDGDMPVGVTVETFELAGHPTAKFAFAWKRAQTRKDVRTPVDVILRDEIHHSPETAFSGWYKVHWHV